MSNSLDALLDIEASVDIQGGARLPDPHEPLAQVISYDNYGSGKDQRVETCGCGQATQFIVPYDHDNGSDVPDERMVRMCFYCDLMPLVARFGAA